MTPDTPSGDDKRELTQQELLDTADKFQPPQEWFDEDFDGISCSLCDSGWIHRCCDDICRNCVEAADCPNAEPCRNCNPDGDIR